MNDPATPTLDPLARPGRGESYVWLCATAVVLAIALTVGLMGFLAWGGLKGFWPQDLYLLRYLDKAGSEQVAAGRLLGVQDNPVDAAAEWHFHTGRAARERGDGDVLRISEEALLAREKPPLLLEVEERSGGVRFLLAESLHYGEANVVPAAAPQFLPALRRLSEPGAPPGTLRATTAKGDAVELPLSDVTAFHAPNTMGVTGKVAATVRALAHFVAQGPRQSNLRGGVFPAIAGTVLLTLLMSVAVLPVGVLAGVYLSEYASRGPFLSVVRIGIGNLAGVPSIVFGVFGLGFFVYGVGGFLDESIFGIEPGEPPLFRTGGILWASLTLALLTLPVVIVATEEALRSVPPGSRAASFACGASRWQTLWRIVLPAAAPGILTGLILAIARGAGEVAPLLLVGAVKSAPTLPVDGEAPFLHLERKFMHLGYHIYDLSAQSPDAEVAMPRIFATAFLLVALILLLNLTALYLRGRLRERYRN